MRSLYTRLIDESSSQLRPNANLTTSSKLGPYRSHRMSPVTTSAHAATSTMVDHGRGRAFNVRREYRAPRGSCGAFTALPAS